MLTLLHKAPRVWWMDIAADEKLALNLNTGL